MKSTKAMKDNKCPKLMTNIQSNDIYLVSNVDQNKTHYTIVYSDNVFNVGYVGICDTRLVELEDYFGSVLLEG